MSRTIEIGRSRSKSLEIAWLCLMALLVISGLFLIILGTGASTAERYLTPPQILPGMGVLYLCAVMTAFAMAKQNILTSVLAKLRAFVVKKIGEPERKAQRNAFVLLTFLIVASSTIHGVAPMYRAFATNYLAGVFTNLLLSIVVAISLFGWLSSYLLSKQSKEKS